MPAKRPSAKTLLQTLRSSFGGPTALDEPRPLEQIVLLILSSRSDIRKARTAMLRIESEYVDWNEVRVTSAYELSRWLRPLGAKKAQAKAEQMKELLSTVYNRFNKLDLDFLHREAKGPAEVRERERFQMYLQEKSIALHVMMSLHASDRQDVVVASGLSRVLQRLGVLNGKKSTVTRTRSKLKDLYESHELVSVQWSFYTLLETYCHARSPDCPDCPVLKLCPMGQHEAKKRRAERQKAAKKAAERARALAKREAAAARKAAAAEKKKAAAEKKAAASEEKKAAAAAKKAAKKLARRLAKRGDERRKAARKPARAAKTVAKKKVAKKKVVKRKSTKRVAKKAAKKKVVKRKTTKRAAKKAAKKRKTTKRTAKRKTTKRTAKRAAKRRPTRKKPVSRKRSAPKRKATKKRSSGRTGRKTSRRR